MSSDCPLYGRELQDKRDDDESHGVLMTQSRPIPQNRNSTRRCNTRPLLVQMQPLIQKGPGAAAPSGKKDKETHKGRRSLDDNFMMYAYKIKLCMRTTTHNWKLCPWAHPGETAALRRHPNCHQPDLCPAVRMNQECPHGETCQYSRNAFESWLHPDRYRTTMCVNGEACTRNICFFAHDRSQLRTPAPFPIAPTASPQPPPTASQQQQQGQQQGQQQRQQQQWRQQPQQPLPVAGQDQAPGTVASAALQSGPLVAVPGCSSSMAECTILPLLDAITPLAAPGSATSGQMSRSASASSLTFSMMGSKPSSGTVQVSSSGDTLDASAAGNAASLTDLSCSSLGSGLLAVSCAQPPPSDVRLSHLAALQQLHEQQLQQQRAEHEQQLRLLQVQQQEQQATLRRVLQQEVLLLLQQLQLEYEHLLSPKLGMQPHDNDMVLPGCLADSRVVQQQQQLLAGLAEPSPVQQWAPRTALPVVTVQQQLAAGMQQQLTPVLQQQQLSQMVAQAPCSGNQQHLVQQMLGNQLRVQVLGNPAPQQVVSAQPLLAQPSAADVQLRQLGQQPSTPLAPLDLWWQ